MKCQLEGRRWDRPGAGQTWRVRAPGVAITHHFMARMVLQRPLTPLPHVMHGTALYGECPRRYNTSTRRVERLATPPRHTPSLRGEPSLGLGLGARGGSRQM